MKKNDADFGGMIDRLFPPKYDFLQMLEEQASITARGMAALHAWIKNGTMSDPNDIEKLEKSLDLKRHEMEDSLMEAFTTPFDRREIYSLAHQMGQILDFAVSTHLEMKAFNVEMDESLLLMTENLNKGLERFLEVMRTMKDDPVKAESLIRETRVSQHAIEKIYINAMSETIRKGDAIEAIRKREIYHHLKDASRSMGTALDILHRIVVSIA